MTSVKSSGGAKNSRDSSHDLIEHRPLAPNDEHSPLRGMLGRLRPHEGLALYQVQSVLLLLQGVPDAELATLHKRVCTTDPLLRPFIRVEMAAERASAKQPKIQKAPKDAFCYICLEGEDGRKSSKLSRGCACRGDSAGFVHLECLTKLAMSKEACGCAEINGAPGELNN